jgi:hypothetical protein
MTRQMIERTTRDLDGRDALLAKLMYDIQQWRFACALLPPALRTPSLIGALLDAVHRPSRRVAGPADRAQYELFDF